VAEFEQFALNPALSPLRFSVAIRMISAATAVHQRVRCAPGRTASSAWEQFFNWT